eukprot:scaffold7987_cov200-Cylindrotheca_fusiformis.AAC.20
MVSVIIDIGAITTVLLPIGGRALNLDDQFSSKGGKLILAEFVRVASDHTGSFLLTLAITLSAARKTCNCFAGRGDA